MPSKLAAYHQNFIKAVRLIIAERNLDSTKAAAEWIGINYMALWKVMDGTNKPTVENCIKLLKKGKFSANWLFLNIGEERLSAQTSIDNIITEIRSLRSKINGFAPTKK